MRTAIALVVVAFVCLPCLGCADQAAYPVSGKVTFQNKPLPAGLIFFDPDVSKKNDGPQGYATIKDGVYNTEDGGKGVIGGPYLVRIQGYDGKAANELPLGRSLFDAFSQPLDLPKAPTTKDFDVPAP